MFRQGDILIERVDELPQKLTKSKRMVLAAGDNTAQRHEIKQRGVAKLYIATGGDLFLEVTADSATVVHPEHGPIELPRGNYRVWRQREFGSPSTYVLD